MAELEAGLRAVGQHEVVAGHVLQRDGVAVEGRAVAALPHRVVALEPRRLGLGRLPPAPAPAPLSEWAWGNKGWGGAGECV